MSNERIPGRPVAIAVAAIILVFVAAWIVLDRSEGRPGWLLAEGPERAVVGSRVEYRITLKKARPGDLIDCTLHHANAERKGWGYLASSGPPRPAVAGRTYTFAFTVPEHDESAFVFALVYLSPSGQWADGTEAATTKYVPLARGGAGERAPVLRRLPVYPYPTAAEAAREAARPPRPRGRPSVWVHPLIGILLAAGALAAARAAIRSGHGATVEQTAWLGFTVLLAAASAAELSGIAGHVAAWGRRLAEARGVYELRKPFQEALTAAAAAASLGLFFLFIRAVRRPGPHRTLWWAAIGSAAYLAVSFVSVLSFHAVDAARGLLWHGVSPVDAVRGAGAVAALAAAFAAGRRRAAT